MGGCGMLPADQARKGNSVTRTGGLKIVIVDDSASTRSLLRAIVRSDGHEVLGEAADGTSAVAAVARYKPQIVTLDVEMPDMDGFVVLDEIVRNHPDTHVVMVSASDDPFSRKRAFDIGAIGYVTKPFNAGQILDNLEQIRLTLQPRPAPKPGPGPRRSCLIVDDNRAVRLLLRAILEGAGVAVQGEAGDGNAAVQLVGSHDPDFVCLDIDLPGKDGLSVLAEIKALKPKIRVIMITSFTDRDTITKAVSLGASGYILKPFEQEKVLALLRRMGVPA